jgi:hypothetical protein
MNNTSNKALNFTEDILERSSLKFFLLNDTAKQVVDSFGNDILGDISIGILKKDYTESSSKMFKQLIPLDAEVSDKEVTFTYDGVKISIKIIHRKYNFFNHLNIVSNKFSDYLIPNPFKKYWKARNLIQ